MKTMNEWMTEQSNEEDNNHQGAVVAPDTDPVRIGNKEVKKTAESPNPLRDRDLNKPMTVVIDLAPSVKVDPVGIGSPETKSKPKQWVWTIKGDDVTGRMKNKSLKESIKDVQQINVLVEEVFNESKLAGGVGLVGLNDLQQAKTTLQRVLNLMSTEPKTPADKLNVLMKSIATLTKGLIQVTYGHQKVFGGLLFQGSKKR